MWQPIETAPKDGRALLLWEQYGKTPFVGFWEHGGWSVCTEHVDAESCSGYDGATVINNIVMPVTHWMPLPEAPAHGITSETGKQPSPLASAITAENGGQQ